jgi:methanogenic corrinoid protein MtbC1
VTRIGDGWSSGELSIGHEHFATNLLNDFLGTVWQRLNERCEGRVCVLATLPGERHVLGLQMCAVVTALAGRQVIYLGADLPVRETIRIANNLRPQALCLSLSPAMPKPEITETLKRLRRDLDSGIGMITGGRGAIDGLTGIERIVEFEQYMQRLTTTA